ncbi:MAG: pyruvate kinase [Phycisphaerae bacterium]
MMIRTKILATVGPACGEVEDLRGMVRAGCDALRINFSHGDDEQRQRFLDNIRTVEDELSEPLAVMADLCGPKIRVGPISGGSVLLADGQELAIQREPLEGRADRISTTLAELVDCVKVGDAVLLDDGRIRLTVVETNPPAEVRCRVVHGGVLAEGKGVNLPDTTLSIPSMTEKDRRDVAWIAGRDFDYVALSFVQSADDVESLRRLLRDSGSDAHVVAKIERPQAVEHIDEIVDAADAVMVARGDLGVEMDLPDVPIAQKRIAALCRRAGKPCIIATQMLESMTNAPQPTRAEVSDVANAVLDCADVVMLSGETAVGDYPTAAVAMMDSIVRETESYADTMGGTVEVTYAPARTTAALAGAVGEIIRREDIAAVAVFTATGTTARVMSKNRPPVPILALSPDEKVVRRMQLYYGVQPVRADAPEHTRDVLAKASEFAMQIGAAGKGQKLLVLSGRPIGTPGTTNTLVVHTVE